MLNILNLWAPPILYCLLLFLQSSVSSLPSFPRFYGADKLLHAGAYTGLGFLFSRAYMSIPRLKGKGWWLLAILSTAAYGACDEFYQSFVPRRHSDFFDFVADLAGGILGAVFYALFRRIYARHR